MKNLALPPDRELLLALEAGEQLLLSGEALTMRDAALARVRSAVERGERPPLELRGQLVFHAGPSPEAAGRPCGSIGPTTSARMDQFLPLLFGLGVAATLGKGPRGEAALALHREHKAVYLAAVGGLGALYGGMVDALVPVAWEELGPEAVFSITLREFPAVVAIDSRGRDHLSEQYAVYGTGKG